MDIQKLSERNKIVKHYAGSHAYGTATPSSDVDMRGIFCAEPINIRTPFFRVDETTDSTEEDTKLFELCHFMKLCVDCNPNIIETLWVDQQDVVFDTPAYQHLRNHRQQLLSTKVAHTMCGYAHSQLQRIKGHNRWLTQAERGLQKLTSAYQAGEIDQQWLEEHFDTETVSKVTTGGIKE